LSFATGLTCSDLVREVLERQLVLLEFASARRKTRLGSADHRPTASLPLADGREATGQRGLGLSTRYSITSSARNRIACETVTPNARAVARLKTSS